MMIRLPLLRPLLLAASLLLALPVSAKEVALTLLHFNDVYQHAPLDGHGGLARLAARAEAARQQAAQPVGVGEVPTQVWLTFGGDLLSPSVASGLTRGAHMIELLNALQVDAAVLGNHEFDFGPEVLRQRLGESSFPWLAANVRERCGHAQCPLPGVRDVLIREVFGVKVAVVGVITANTRLSSKPGPEQRFAPPVRTAIELARRLRANKQADVVIGLTHLDLAEDRQLARSHLFDVIVGGHDHGLISEVVAGTPIFKAGSDARQLVRATLSLDDQSRKVTGVAWAIDPLTTEPLPRVQNIVNQVEARLQQALAQEIGATSQPLDARNATVRSTPAPIGELVADAFRSAAGADIAIVNGGGLRVDGVLPAGPLTQMDIKRLLPFENHLLTLAISGADLRQLFDDLAGHLGAGPAGLFPHLSGMNAELAPKRPAGQRVLALTVGGEPVQPERQYKLAVSDYLASGRNHYDVLARQPRLVPEDAAPLETSAVIDYIRQQQVVGREPFTPRLRLLP